VGSTIGNLRRVSIADAVSYLMLLAAAVVKQGGGTETGVAILGPIHGVLYLVFALLVLVARQPLGWPWTRALMALVIGSLPLGGFWLERQWLAPRLNTVAAGLPDHQSERH